MIKPSASLVLEGGIARVRSSVIGMLFIVDRGNGSGPGIVACQGVIHNAAGPLPAAGSGQILL